MKGVLPRARARAREGLRHDGDPDLPFVSVATGMLSDYPVLARPGDLSLTEEVPKIGSQLRAEKCDHVCLGSGNVEADRVVVQPYTVVEDGARRKSGSRRQGDGREDVGRRKALRCDRGQRRRRGLRAKWGSLRCHCGCGLRRPRARPTCQTRGNRSANQEHERYADHDQCRTRARAWRTRCGQRRFRIGGTVSVSRRGRNRRDGRGPFGSLHEESVNSLSAIVLVGVATERGRRRFSSGVLTRSVSISLQLALTGRDGGLTVVLRQCFVPTEPNRAKHKSTGGNRGRPRGATQISTGEVWLTEMVSSVRG